MAHCLVCYAIYEYILDDFQKDEVSSSLLVQLDELACPWYYLSTTVLITVYMVTLMGRCMDDVSVTTCEHDLFAAYTEWHVEVTMYM